MTVAKWSLGLPLWDYILLAMSLFLMLVVTTINKKNSPSKSNIVLVFILSAMQYLLFTSTNFMQFLIAISIASFSYYTFSISLHDLKPKLSLGIVFLNFLGLITLMSAVIIFFQTFESFSFNGIYNLITIKQISKAENHSKTIEMFNIARTILFAGFGIKLIATIGRILASRPSATGETNNTFSILYGFFLVNVILHFYEKSRFLMPNGAIINSIKIALIILMFTAVFCGMISRKINTYLHICTSATFLLQFYYTTSMSMGSWTSSFSMFLTNILVQTIVLQISNQEDCKNLSKKVVNFTKFTGALILITYIIPASQIISSTSKFTASFGIVELTKGSKLQVVGIILARSLLTLLNCMFILRLTPKNNTSAFILNEEPIMFKLGKKNKKPKNSSKINTEEIVQDVNLWQEFITSKLKEEQTRQMISMLIIAILFWMLRSAVVTTQIQQYQNSIASKGISTYTVVYVLEFFALLGSYCYFRKKTNV